ncbi:hypothetical protein CTAYLR_008703 [Chrysophaeum taylorii]|uniref:DNA-directed primase/polymerase protein n=1 Tax=Chrysophaeum taylorii TaxID=2483200 RepID=A0AAD7UK52_9STRA|nr:hypothetical protein CTAYLR_008703 [Chrysophaeum taylorii]
MVVKRRWSVDVDEEEEVVDHGFRRPPKKIDVDNFYEKGAIVPYDGTWREFPKQAMAFGFVDDWGTEDPPRLWAMELAEGKRRYVAAHWARFRKEYEARAERHFYELIREKTAVRPYFDLESTTTSEPRTETRALATEFLDVVAIELSDFGAECRREGHFEVQADLSFAVLRGLPVVDDDGVRATAFNEVIAPQRYVVLEASTPTKFSQHAVFPDCLVKSTRDLGVFVAGVLARYPRYAGIVDLSVYSRNRLFRLCGSAKRGKTNTLVHVSSDDILPEETLVVPATRRSRTEPLGFDDDPALLPHPQTPRRRREQQSRDAAVVVVPPPKDLEAFVLGCRPGSYVRKRERLSPSRLAFHLAGNNRYCERIQRHHKSNNVYLVVDLDTRLLFQRCHDPDCRGFAGFPVPLPPRLGLSTKT